MQKHHLFSLLAWSVIFATPAPLKGKLTTVECLIGRVAATDPTAVAIAMWQLGLRRLLPGHEATTGYGCMVHLGCSTYLNC